jgi:hypothetical protein
MASWGQDGSLGRSILIGRWDDADARTGQWVVTGAK